MKDERGKRKDEDEQKVSQDATPENLSLEKSTKIDSELAYMQESKPDDPTDIITRPVAIVPDAKSLVDRIRELEAEKAVMVPHANGLLKLTYELTAKCDELENDRSRTIGKLDAEISHLRSELSHYEKEVAKHGTCGLCKAPLTHNDPGWSVLIKIGPACLGFGEAHYWPVTCLACEKASWEALRSLLKRGPAEEDE